ncbi:hypothetical protein GCM10020000_01790 [Streptomyces olivoverticillatus]
MLDECTEQLRPGGAALAAYLAAAAGHDVTLVTALGTDPASRQVRALLEPHVTIVALPLDGQLPEKTRVLAHGRPVVRLDRGTGRAAGATEQARRALTAARTLLVADYARGSAEALWPELAARAARAALVWDPPTRAAARPSPAPAWPPPHRPRSPPLHRGTTRPRHRRRRTGRGGPYRRPPRTALAGRVRRGDPRRPRRPPLPRRQPPLLVPAPARHGGDACGAGDCFAATAAGLLGDGALPAEAVQGAVAAATRYVAAGGPRAAAPGRPLPPAETAAGADALRLAEHVRAAGGTVVAAGGCFDLLHAGHVALLQQARGIGDCLIVCMNSDASVRRRKGVGRPVNSLADRIRVLEALQCVDAVAVFDEDTPERLLPRLRPHIWVKGGDYAVEQLPEAAQLAEWGGQAVLLPYLDGRSSTRLAGARAASGAGEQSARRR